MIKEISEAICESIGSMMDTHSTRNCNLGPENFSNEMVLRVNLGPLHLMGNLIGEILALDNAKLYARTEKRLKQLPSKDINKTTIDTFEQKNEKKS